MCIDSGLLSVVYRVESGVLGARCNDLDDGFTDGLCVQTQTSCLWYTEFRLEGAGFRVQGLRFTDKLVGIGSALSYTEFEMLCREVVGSSEVTNTNGDKYTRIHTHIHKHKHAYTHTHAHTHKHTHKNV